MAIGTYVEEAGPQEVKGKSMGTRMAIVGAAIALTMCAAVVLVGFMPSSSGPVEMMLKSAGMTGKDLQLAVGIIHSAPHASVSELEQMLQRWKSDDIASLGQDGTQMLASDEGMTTALDDSGRLCAKKDVILAKLDQLTAKLAAQGAVLNATDAESLKAKMDALGAWLDSESSYRLMKEKVKEASEGAKYARASYEKTAEAAKKSQERVDQLTTQYGKEQADINAERDLIKEIMRLLGIMDDLPLDEKSKAAGGYMQPSSAAKADPVTLKMVKAKIAELRQRVASDKTGLGRMQQLDSMSSKLASYAETDEIKKILLDLLKDCKQREQVIQKVLQQANEDLEIHKKDLIKYETELVDLSNAADKAKQQADAENLKRQNLAGKKTTDAETYEDEHAAYLLTSPPTEKEIFIIYMIKKKINEFCAAPAAAPAAA